MSREAAFTSGSHASVAAVATKRWVCQCFRALYVMRPHGACHVWHDVLEQGQPCDCITSAAQPTCVELRQKIDTRLGGDRYLLRSF